MSSASPFNNASGWDVVLSDGSTARVRCANPQDAPQIEALHARLSPESVRLRYLGAHPHMSPVELASLLECSNPDHLALVAERAGVIIGISQYDRVPGSDVAEVAFVVDDEHQGLGIGTLLLEYLASEGRHSGLKRFAADTLWENDQMVQVFRDAGFTQRSRVEAGVIRVVMDISPTPEALAALYERDRKATARSMEHLLRPTSVAVIGASRTPGTVGHELVRNLVTGGFKGPVFPVNPTASHVASIPAFPAIEDVPGKVDLAIVAVPAVAVPDVVEACGRKGVGALVIVSSHFAEDGADGAALERRVARMAHSYGMRVVGPNCFGVLNTDPEISMNATFAKDTPVVGKLGFASQSGGLGIAILAEAKKRGIGLSDFVSMGNKADVSGNDLLCWWSEDHATDVGLLYLESFGNPRRFARLARQLSRNKPIIAVKAGRSSVGRRAASSHTAALASSDEPTSALFGQTGVIRVDTIEELFDVAQVVGSQPLARGLRAGVLSNVGGPGVLAADALVSNGLQVPEFSAQLQQEIAALCPRNGGVTNPIDLGAEANAPMYEQVLGLLLASDEIDGVVVNFTPPLVNRRTDEVAKAIVNAVDSAAAASGAPAGSQEPRPALKPVVVSLLGAEEVGRAILSSASFPVPSYTYPENAVRALAHSLRYAEWRSRPAGTVPVLEGVDVNEARRRLPSEPDGAHGAVPANAWLTGSAAMDVLGAFGIPVVKTVEVFNASEAGKWAEEISGPVALKVLGPVHKSEGGGVQLGLEGSEAVSSAYRAMQDAFGDEMTGALLQPMVPPGGVEILIGAVQDPSFGPLVVFGLGGVNVEILGDHVSRLAPLTDLEAQDMVNGLKGSAILKGYRGRPGVDIDGLVDVLHRISRLAEDMPEVAELDCNPVIATPQGVLVVDARLRIDTDAARPLLEDTRHLR
ncbi:MAG TPA: GNAT family N-acetyltransferase [Acidimicrobiales bacterium]|nr:GNAT family N-acetyltransferase [Acidimicrobiales bacterium]